MTGKQKGDVLGDVCPYCGRKFKRLKSHLNHCKMAPAVTSSKSLDKDAPLMTTVVKSKKKTATATSQDRFSSSSQISTEHLSDLKMERISKTTVKSAPPPALGASQTTNPVSESLSEKAGQLKRKWQGRNTQETEKDKLSALLMEKGRKSSAKAAALGKITLAADVLKGKARGKAKTEVTAAKPQSTSRSNSSLRLTAEENRHLAPLTASTVSVQEPKDKAIHKPHPKDNQHINLKPQIQTHFQEEVKSSRQSQGQDLMRVKELGGPLSHTYKVVKTSVWEHIKSGLLGRKYRGPMTPSLVRTKLQVGNATGLTSAVKTSVWEHINGGLLGRKYGGPMTPSLVRTKLQVGNATSLTSDVTVSPPQPAINPQKVVVLEGPFMKPPDSSRPAQASPIQGLLASHSDSLRSKPQSLDWISAVTGGYGMEVYRPPGKMAQGHEQFWTKPSSGLPPPPKPLPVSKVLGGPKRPQGPSSSLNPGRRALSPSIVPLAERKLGDVTLNELIPWLADRTPQSPREGLAIFKNGWQWYYKRYIDVRKGGIGGIGMLVAGYCVLSYVWSYPHLKHERWRKYH